MNWESFFRWLEQNGVRYSPGDYHFEGRGYWFPQPPTLDQDIVAPKPPPPWIYVFKGQVEMPGRTIPTVDVSTSFSPPVFDIEDPAVAQRVVQQALMDFDMAQGADELRAPEPRWAPLPPVLPVVHGQRLEHDYTQVEQAWREKNRAVLSKRGSSSGPDVSPRYVSTGEETDEDREVKAQMLRERKKREDFGGADDDIAEFEAEEGDVCESCGDKMVEGQRLWQFVRGARGMYCSKACARGEGGARQFVKDAEKGQPFGQTPDDSDVSDNCDLGAHERCAGCGCNCHWRKQCGTCGRVFTAAQWRALKTIGKQKIEADDEGPASTIVLKNCGCGSTLGVEEIP